MVWTEHHLTDLQGLLEQLGGLFELALLSGVSEGRCEMERKGDGA